jgi:hypothetical protein
MKTKSARECLRSEDVEMVTKRLCCEKEAAVRCSSEEKLKDAHSIPALPLPDGVSKEV